MCCLLLWNKVEFKHYWILSLALCSSGYTNKFKQFIDSYMQGIALTFELLLYFMVNFIKSSLA